VSGALPDAKAETVVNFLIEKVIYVHGVPEMIHSDLGPEFANELTRRMDSFLGIKKTATTAYHPQGNGICERVHRSLHDTLAKLCSPDQKDWDLYVAAAVCACNFSPHSSTGQSPYFLMHGRDPQMGVDVLLNQNAPKPQSQRAFVSDTVRRLEAAFPAALQHIRAEQQRQKRYYDEDRKDHTFAEGDLVLLHRPSVDALPGQRRKLIRPWKGPYRIRKLLGTGSLLAEIQGVNNTKDVQKVSIQRLKHFYQAQGDVTPPQPDTFEVESIEDERAARAKKGKREFLVKYKGFSRRLRTWVKEEDLNAPELLERWRLRRSQQNQQSTLEAPTHIIPIGRVPLTPAPAPAMAAASVAPPLVAVQAAAAVPQAPASYAANNSAAAVIPAAPPVARAPPSPPRTPSPRQPQPQVQAAPVPPPPPAPVEDVAPVLQQQVIADIVAPALQAAVQAVQAAAPAAANVDIPLVPPMPAGTRAHLARHTSKPAKYNDFVMVVVTPFVRTASVMAV